MQIFDSHAHYDDKKFDADRDAVLLRLKDANVTRCINIGCDVQTSIASCELARKYDFIFTAIRNPSK